MSDKVQLIKKEIERQIEKGKVKCQQSKENNNHESLVAWSEHVATCGKLLVFINSLPEEPVSENRINECLNWDKDWGCSTSPINKCDHCPRTKWVEAKKEKKNYNERYERIAQTEQFKKSYCDKSLGKEEHASEDLEEEIDRFEDWINNFNQSDYPTSYTVRDIARHFAEWQKQKDLEDSLKSDMTMPNKFYKKGKADAMKEMKESLQTEYEKGRFDMREEMMKNTVLETKVMMDSDGDGIETPYEEWLTLENTEIPYIPDNLGLKDGDKVKILIVKEE